MCVCFLCLLLYVLRVPHLLSYFVQPVYDYTTAAVSVSFDYELCTSNHIYILSMMGDAHPLSPGPRVHR